MSYSFTIDVNRIDKSFALKSAGFQATHDRSELSHCQYDVLTRRRNFFSKQIPHPVEAERSCAILLNLISKIVNLLPALRRRDVYVQSLKGILVHAPGLAKICHVFCPKQSDLLDPRRTKPRC